MTLIIETVNNLTIKNRISDVALGDTPILVDPRGEGTSIEVMHYLETYLDDGTFVDAGIYAKTVFVRKESDRQRWERVIEEERDFNYQLNLNLTKPRDVVPFRVSADRGLGNRPDVQKRVRTIIP